LPSFGFLALAVFRVNGDVHGDVADRAGPQRLHVLEGGRLGSPLVGLDGGDTHLHQCLGRVKQELLAHLELFVGVAAVARGEGVARLRDDHPAFDGLVFWKRLFVDVAALATPDGGGVGLFQYLVCGRPVRRTRRTGERDA